MDCPDENQMSGFLLGGTSANDRLSLEAHIDLCSNCREILSEVVRAQVTDDPTDSGRIGRYVVEEIVGAGAMGMVYRCFDPELRRVVAIKLLDEGCPIDGREGEALAKLAHPNVVAVHDVGRFGERVFIAMEHVEGVSLSEWLLVRTRPWQEIARAFVQAARGLAAAHAAGIVHRDFKPSNVLIGRDGRVRVADFGLASMDSAGSASAAGTPAYMAPEQRAGRASARSDQFSFCVAMCEALCGRRPAIGSSPRLPDSSRRSILKSLRAILEQGLSSDPDRRLPDMDFVADAIERALARDGRRGPGWLVAPFLGLLVLAGLGWRWTGDEPSAGEPISMRDRALIARAWSQARILFGNLSRDDVRLPLEQRLARIAGEIERDGSGCVTAKPAQDRIAITFARCRESVREGVIGSVVAVYRAQGDALIASVDPTEIAWSGLPIVWSARGQLSFDAGERRIELSADSHGATARAPFQAHQAFSFRAKSGAGDCVDVRRGHWTTTSGGKTESRSVADVRSCD